MQSPMHASHQSFTMQKHKLAFPLSRLTEGDTERVTMRATE